jgi:hypothetical protein
VLVERPLLPEKLGTVLDRPPYLSTTPNFKL